LIPTRKNLYAESNEDAGKQQSQAEGGRRGTSGTVEHQKVVAAITSIAAGKRFRGVIGVVELELVGECAVELASVTTSKQLVATGIGDHGHPAGIRDISLSVVAGRILALGCRQENASVNVSADGAAQATMTLGGSLGDPGERAVARSYIALIAAVFRHQAVRKCRGIDARCSPWVEDG